METPQLLISDRKTVDLLIEGLSLITEQNDQLKLVGHGGNVTRCVEIGQMLCEEVGASMVDTKVSSEKVFGQPLAKIEITVSLDARTKLDRENGTDHQIARGPSKQEFVNYSTYQLLIADLLERHSLVVYGSKTYTNKNGQKHKTDGNHQPPPPPSPLFTLYKREGKHYMKLLPIRKKPQDKPGQNSKPNSKDRTGDNLREALSRCGLFPPRNWHEIANKLSKHDDVVLGLDTNVLRNAFVTAQLLPSLSLVEPKKYVHTPNWILLVVPGTTMFELEEAANARTEGGQLNYTGRAGFRALQEILTLSENVDISGLSLLIAGEADPVLDAKSELKSISKGIEALNNNSRGHHSYKVYKSSSGDMTIRSQFKNMLRQLDFHKGAYFITADKTNAALALAEGLQPIFVGSPEYPRLNQEICLEEQSPIQQFSLGKLLYELAVAFGDFRITTKDKSFSFALEADKKGESLHNWLHKKLRIHNSDLNKLVNQYRGRFDLKKAVSLYQSLTKDFETVDWLAELTHAFEEEVEDFINEEEMI